VTKRDSLEMPTLDFDQLAKTLSAGGAASRESIGAVIGVRLTDPAVRRLEEHAKHNLRSGNGLASLLAVVQRAAASGLAWERLPVRRGLTLHLLAVRWPSSSGQWLVSLGLATTASRRLDSHWKALDGWTQPLEANVERAQRWARLTSGLTTFELLKAPSLPTTGEATTEQQLLAGIVANPDDDGARLVYADWLLERGDAKGEFIRLDVEYARTNDNALLVRRRAMLEASWTDFAGELTKWTTKHGFERGLVNVVKMTVPAFEKHGERLFSTFPLEALELADQSFTPESLERLGSAPGFDRVRRLMIHQPSTRVTTGPENRRVRPLAALAKGTRYASLRALSTTFCGHSGEDWYGLFSGLQAPRLSEVELSFNHSHPSILRGLAASSSPLTELREYTLGVLELPTSADWTNAMEALSAKDTLRRVTFEQSRHLDDASLAALFAPTARCELERLTLTSVPVSDALLFAIAKSPRAKRLTSLVFHNGRFTSEGALALLRLPSLSRLAFSGGYGEEAWSPADLERWMKALRELPSTHSLQRVSLPAGSPSLTSLGKLRVD